MGIKKSRGSKKGKEFELREAKEWRGTWKRSKI
jgi:hypothetical protein